MTLLYGKIKNGVLEYAPETYVSSVITIQNFNQDEKLMKEFGYKEVIQDGYMGGEYTTYQEMEESTNCILIHNRLDNSEKVLSNYKRARINQTLSNLESYLDCHPLTSSVKGKEHLYTVTQEKQNQLTSTIADYISNALPYIITALTKGLIGDNLSSYMDSLEIDIYWNSRGDTCEKWKYSEIFQLKNEIVAYVRPIVEYQRYLEKQISLKTSQLDILNLDISFTADKIKAYQDSIKPSV